MIDELRDATQLPRDPQRGFEDESPSSATASPSTWARRARKRLKTSNWRRRANSTPVANEDLSRYSSACSKASGAAYWRAVIARLPSYPSCQARQEVELHPSRKRSRADALGGSLAARGRQRRSPGCSGPVRRRRVRRHPAGSVPSSYGAHDARLLTHG